jgi:flagellar assembly protein FliH
LPTFSEAGAPAHTIVDPIDEAARERAEQEILAAQAYAQQILAEAEQAALLIRQGAENEAMAIRAQASTDGYIAGQEAAAVDVAARMQTDFEARIVNLQADVNAVIASIEAERAHLWRQTEKDIVAFSIEMAKKIIKTEVAENPKVIGEVIKHALRRVVSKEHIRIRISPADIDGVRAQREDLLLVLDGAANLDIVDDRRVEQGGCVIETTAGTIDAKIETQIDRMVEALEAE